MTTTATARLATGAPGSLVHAADVPGLGRLEVSALDPVADLDIIHRWVTAPSARFWGLGDLTPEELRDLYTYVDGLTTHHAFLIRRDGLPIVLLQTYEPENDPVGEVTRCNPAMSASTSSSATVARPRLGSPPASPTRSQASCSRSRARSGS